MPKRKEIAICPTCGIKFPKKNIRHIYCVRRCFKRAYMEKIKKGKTFPFFICPECGEKTHLDFYPASSKKKWNNFKCPNCDFANSFYSSKIDKLNKNQKLAQQLCREKALPS